MILTCGFVLLNKPLELNLKFQDVEKIVCEPQPFSYLDDDDATWNSLINMYTCPFVDNQNKGVTYLISAGLKSRSAILYRKNGSTGEVSAWAVINGMVTGKMLIKNRESGILTKYGRLYVFIRWDADIGKEEKDQWLEFVKKSE